MLLPQRLAVMMLIASAGSPAQRPDFVERPFAVILSQPDGPVKCRGKVRRCSKWLRADRRWFAPDQDPALFAGFGLPGAAFLLLRNVALERHDGRIIRHVSQRVADN